jgi:hypothetical protein
MTRGSRAIESMLYGLGDHIDWPEHPDQVPAVLRRLATQTEPVKRRDRSPLRPRNGASGGRRARPGRRRHLGRGD